VAREQPGAIALRDPNTAVTYAELVDGAEARAARLRQLGLPPGGAVALALEPTADLVMWALATLEAGGAYVALDPRSPASRNDFILEDVSAWGVIGADAPQSRFGHSPEDGSGIFTPADSPALSPRTPPLTAYVIYTSGTTGTPKGVAVSHANAGALLDATARIYEVGPRDVWLQFHSLSFDYSVWEVWGALTTGGRLEIPDRLTRSAPDDVADLVVDARVTVLSLTPTAFAMVAPELLARESPRGALRHLLIAGEPLPGPMLRHWVERLGTSDPSLHNMYGPTETTVFATHHRISERDLDHVVPIGRLLHGFEATVEPLDDGDDDAVCGELVLGGPQVARYVSADPDRRFEGSENGGRRYRTGDRVMRLADGELVFLGRSDRQLKVRGHRIEPDEVECAIGRHEDIQRVIVLTEKTRYLGTSLVCAYSSHAGRPIPDDELRRHVRGLLPEYMWPARFAWIETMPTTASGKVDAAAITRHLHHWR
jgi:amino acid adenylation domain-containing protein